MQPFQNNMGQNQSPNQFQNQGLHQFQNQGQQPSFPTAKRQPSIKKGDANRIDLGVTIANEMVRPRMGVGKYMESQPLGPHGGRIGGASRVTRESAANPAALSHLLQPSQATTSGRPSCSVAKSGTPLSSLASWNIDSGASDHMSAHKLLFHDFNR
ncbi:hypothetical protein LIER_37894 [Lithospermum erythrorhizon]